MTFNKSPRDPAPSGARKMRPLEGQLVASARFSVTQPRWLPSIAMEGDERLAEGGTEMNEGEKRARGRDTNSRW